MLDAIQTSQFRLSARRAVSAAPTIGGGGSTGMPALLDGRHGGMAYGGSPNRSMYHRNEQYGMFQSSTFSAIRLIANRMARPATKVALLAPDGKKFRPEVREKNLRLPKSMESQLAKMRPIDTHPILDALNDPNPMMLAYQLKLVTFMGIEIFGDYYWWMERLTNNAGDEKWRIWPVPPHWLYEAYDKDGRVDSTLWTIRPPGAIRGVTVPASSIVMFRYPDPYDPLGVLSTMQALARPISIDAAGELAIEAQMRNSANPGLAIITGRPQEFLGLTGTGTDQMALTSAQRDELMSWFRDRYQGFTRAGEPLILDGLIKDVKQLNSLLSTMDNSVMAAYNEAKIYKGFAVNRISMGDVEAANRATASVADEHLVVNALEPRTTMVNQTLTRYMGRYMADDRGPVAVYQEVSVIRDEELDLRRQCEMIDRGVWSRNEVRAEQGKPPITGGDEIFLHDSAQGGGGQWVPVRVRDEEQQGLNLDALEEFADADADEEKEDQDKRRTPAGRKGRYGAIHPSAPAGILPGILPKPTEDGWRTWLKEQAAKTENVRRRIENQLRKVIRKWLREKFRDARAALRSPKPGDTAASFVHRAWPADSLRKDLARVVFPTVEAAAAAAIEFEWRSYRDAKSADRQIKDAATDSALLSQLVGAGKKAANDAANSIGKLAVRIWNWLRRQFRKTEDGIRQDNAAQQEQGGEVTRGNPAADAAKKIANEILTNEQADKKSEEGSRGPATTIFNDNRDRVASLLARAGRVSHQVWMTQRDVKVRDTHRAAEGQQKLPGGTFVVGGHQCLYPGDPALPASERSQCRCFQITVYK